MAFEFLYASFTLLLLTTQQCLGDGGCCYESILLPAGAVDFDIQAQLCPMWCFQCDDYLYVIFYVTWDDQQGHRGTASENTDETYKVSFQDPIFPGRYDVLITYEYICVSPIHGDDFEGSFTTHKTLIVYGANIVYYQDKQTGAIDVTCKTGITGVANDEITMSISFTGDDTNTTCSTICNNGPQVPCDWNSMEWIESEGTCTIVANATVANSGGFCCDNNAVDSRVIACENVSIVKDCIITPSEDPANHSSQPSILVDSVIGVSCLLLIVLIVIGIVVFYWKRRNRYNEVPHHQLPIGGDGGRYMRGH